MLRVEASFVVGRRTMTETERDELRIRVSRLEYTY